MRTVSDGGTNAPTGGPGFIDTSAPPAVVAGATTVAVLIISLVVMSYGAEAQRALLTLSIAAILYATLHYAPMAGVPLILTYLAGMGALKRYLIPFLGYSSLDPLLLAQPLIIGLVFTNLAIRRRIPTDTLLSKLIAALLIFMAAEVANPLQGGVTIALSGILFYIVPVLWFYCGRTVGTKALVERLLRTVVAIALLGAVYGLWQQFVGFSDIEKQWIEATNLGDGQYIGNGILRVFSIFSAFAEYVAFLGIGAVISFAMLLRQNRFAIFPFMFLLGSIFLSSSRGALLMTLFGCTLVWAVQGRHQRSWAPRLALAAFLGVAGLVTGLTQIKSVDIQDDTAETIVQFQARGILGASSKQQSTGIAHGNLVLSGIRRGFVNPLGIGLGSTTIAAGKFGISNGGSSEFDLGDIFISCGALGGILYTVIVLYTIWRAMRAWHLRRDMISLCIFAILLSSTGAWLMGARYSSCMLIWFLIGSLDRADRDEEQKKQQIPGESGAQPLPRSPLRFHSGFSSKPVPAISAQQDWER